MNLSSETILATRERSEIFNKLKEKETNLEFYPMTCHSEVDNKAFLRQQKWKLFASRPDFEEILRELFS